MIKLLSYNYYQNADLSEFEFVEEETEQKIDLTLYKDGITVTSSGATIETIKECVSFVENWEF